MTLTPISEMAQNLRMHIDCPMLKVLFRNMNLHQQLGGRKKEILRTVKVTL
jgi:hypothetical protein